MIYKQQLRTTHDTNGNPRRVWLLYNAAGEVIDTADEGYAGDPFRGSGAIQLPSISVTPSEYKFWTRRQTPGRERREHDRG